MMGGVRDKLHPGPKKKPTPNLTDFSRGAIWRLHLSRFGGGEEKLRRREKHKFREKKKDLLIVRRKVVPAAVKSRNFGKL